MSEKRIQQIEFRLQPIKRALLEIGPMRPGSLTRQYKDPQHHVGAYWQISYTRRMKSRTEYVRKEWVKEVRRQIATYKRFTTAQNSVLSSTLHLLSKSNVGKQTLSDYRVPRRAVSNLYSAVTILQQGSANFWG